MDYSNLIFAFIYLDRMLIRKNLVLCLNNVYRLILACVVLSIKFNDDSKFKNSYYSKVGGVSLVEMNAIEYNTYYRLNFNLYVSLDEYLYYAEKLLSFGSEEEEEE